MRGLRAAAVWSAASIVLGTMVALLFGGLGFYEMALARPDATIARPEWRVLVGAALVLLGLVLGAGLIVTGQGLRLLITQQVLLARVHRRLRRWEDEREIEREHPMRVRRERVERR